MVFCGFGWYDAGEEALGVLDDVEADVVGVLEVVFGFACLYGSFVNLGELSVLLVADEEAGGVFDPEAEGVELEVGVVEACGHVLLFLLPSELTGCGFFLRLVRFIHFLLLLFILFGAALANLVYLGGCVAGGDDVADFLPGAFLGSVFVDHDEFVVSDGGDAGEDVFELVDHGGGE